jgi:hypothetical protein
MNMLIRNIMLLDSSIVLPDLISLDFDDFIENSLGSLDSILVSGALVLMIYDQHVIMYS